MQTVNNPGWSIRLATVEDTATLADIVIEAIKAQGRWTPMSPTEVDDWRKGYADWCAEQVEAADPGNTLSVIEEREQPVGRLRIVRDIFADGATQAQVCRIELAGLQLRPSSQGHGIGTAIIRELQGEAARDQVPLELGVEKDNPHARRLYERLGFAHVGENESEYLMRWVESS